MMRLIATVASIIFIVFAFLAKVPTYRTAPVFLIPILWGVYLLRKRIALRTVDYFLFALAVILHASGAFGFYQRSFFGISFDVYVHTYFGFVGTLIIHNGLREKMRLGAVATAVAAVLLVMGVGAIHEIVEYVSYLLLGEQRGMLKPSTSYYFDTQRDLVCNLCGAIAAVLIEQLRARRRPIDAV